MFWVWTIFDKLLISIWSPSYLVNYHQVTTCLSSMPDPVADHVSFPHPWLCQLSSKKSNWNSRSHKQIKEMDLWSSPSQNHSRTKMSRYLRLRNLILRCIQRPWKAEWLSTTLLWVIPSSSCKWLPRSRYPLLTITIPVEISMGTKPCLYFVARQSKSGMS